MAMRAGAQDEAVPGSILLVIHDFVARSADELSLAKGDRIELIERDDDFGDGWFLGRHMANAKNGLFPASYTTSAPKGTFNNTSQNRRASEGPPKTPTARDDAPATSPTQQRHASASGVSSRPTSGQQSSASPIAQVALRTSLSTSASASRTSTFNADSPVMSETLSVIDEHMNDMNTPRSSFTNGDKSELDRGDSVYSTKPLSRLSYIAGHETDEEERQLHSEEEVMAWGPERVAEYLDDNGVEKMHCDVFKEQEITGEVLLAMDQSSLFIKEFELGPVGRRLRTWHKIKALQDEVRRSASSDVARTGESSETADETGRDGSRSRASTTGTILPRALDTPGLLAPHSGRTSALQSISQAAAAAGPNRSSVISPLQSMTSISRPENTYRPSAQTIRQMQHSRRHSSIDSSRNSVDSSSNRLSHRKQPSIDKKWEPGQLQTNGRPGSHTHAPSSESLSVKRESSFGPASPGELDRGYFSSTEVENRSHPKKTVLTKKGNSTASNTPSHSRTGSQQRASTQQDSQTSRLSSSNSLRSPVSPFAATPLGGLGGSLGTSSSIFGSRSSHSSKFSGLRSATMPLSSSKSMTSAQASINPVVTKLDPSASSNPAAASPTGDSKSSDKVTSSPTSNQFSFFASSKAKLTGLRTISDAITRHEKSSASPIKEEVASPTRTGSTTPSTDARSIDLQKSEAQSRTSQGSGANLAASTNLKPPPTSQRRTRPKTKKATSAYTRGLERKTPAEQLKACDYSGWMRKKSGSLMTTWKPRLFILRGRRLSYYYSEDDTEEKGLIDISFHRVLPAHNETLTGLHLAFTGVGGAPISPKESTTPTTAQQDLKEHPAKPGEDGEGLFIFKLVPPKSGLSKGVNFTKPTVHYFAVNSRQEGRLWMAALMKATIDRDEDGVVTTTYSQKTISLAKARARRERPPALREETEERAELDAGDESSSRGLGISEKDDDETTAGASRELGDASSVAPSTSVTATENDALNDKEREAVALMGHT